MLGLPQVLSWIDDTGLDSALGLPSILSCVDAASFCNVVLYVDIGGGERVGRMFGHARGWRSWWGRERANDWWPRHRVSGQRCRGKGNKCELESSACMCSHFHVHRMQPTVLPACILASFLEIALVFFWLWSHNSISVCYWNWHNVLTRLELPYACCEAELLRP